LVRNYASGPFLVCWTSSPAWAESAENQFFQLGVYQKFDGNFSIPEGFPNINRRSLSGELRHQVTWRELERTHDLREILGILESLELTALREADTRVIPVPAEKR